MYVLHAIRRLPFIKIIVFRIVRIQLINHKESAYLVQGALRVMEALSNVHHAFQASFYTMGYVTHNVLTVHSKIRQQKLVNFAHQIVPLVEIPLFASVVLQIFIFTWVNAQRHALSLLLLQYQTRSKFANNALFNVQNALR